MSTKSFFINNRLVTITYFTREENSALGWMFFIMIAIVWFSNTFFMPDESDYHTSSMCTEAHDFLTENIANQEKSYWKPFERKSSTAGNYNPLDIQLNLGIDPTNRDNIKKSITYLGEGKYEIVDGFTSKVYQTFTSSGNKITVDIGTKTIIYRAYVQTTPKRNWYGTIDKQWRILSYNVLSDRTKIEK